MKITARIYDGKMQISEYNRKTLNDFVHNPENKGTIVMIESRTPESRQVRKFYHGALLPLWAYLNGWDYRDSEITEFLHEHAKREFNGEIVKLDGKQIRRGKSTKGMLTKNGEQNSGYIERIISYLEENYGIDRTKVLNTEHYKDFRDRIYMDGKYDTYIDYLKDLHFL